ncbi:ATP-binding protein [Frankia gtarii]|uniref:ATP-binding protein n=1 Tax=Frankia gtarii TaxID=2950102 RepID=UPI0021C1441D|nr:ATP-binding protein [Frankia gtarii]
MTERGWARPITDASWADLDPREFERFRRLVGAAGSRADAVLAGLPDRELAAALGVAGQAASQQGTAGPALLPEALLLFGRPEAIRWFLPWHEAAMQVLRADEAVVNDFFHWPLFRLAEELLARFRARNTEQVVRFELVRVQVPAFSELAFRELITNALTHRDYDVPGAVHVRWADDRIEITNPVGPAAGPPPGTVLAGPPRPRNPLLVDAFRRAGIAHRTGHGIARAVADQLRHGLAAPRFDHPAQQMAVAILPAASADLAFARYVAGRERLGQPLGRAELQLVTALRHGQRLRTAQAAALLATDRSQARAHLVGLLQAGLVQVGGDSAGRTWHLTDQVHRDLRECAAHVRAQTSGRHPAAPTPTAPSGWAIPGGGPALPHRQRAADGG